MDNDHTSDSTQEGSAPVIKTSPSTTTSLIILHHLENSRSQRILWLLEELEVPYEIKHYKRTDQGLAPKDLLAIHPLGKSPIITDGAITLSESGVIVEYIIMKYGSEKAKVSAEGWLDNTFFTHYAEGSLQPNLVHKLLFKRIPQKSPVLLRPLAGTIFKQLDALLVSPELERHGKYIEDHLVKVDGWFAGGPNPTSADYMMSFPLETFISRSPENVGPRTRQFVTDFQARPAYQRALRKGGKYDYVVPP